jgi:asparagine synthase (glutamine-hydrolysing)
MCGIAGICSLDKNRIPEAEHSLRVMNELQKHRGPDAQTFWYNDENTIGFAHQRLSIIDLSTGNQPLSNDSGLTICYNGEIYNYKELKTQLPSYNYKTNSDTEVILAYYQKYGSACVNYLRGMFSFAIWDQNKKELFIVRDRFGIKPLYYTVSDNKFYFASEIKTLLPFIDQVKVNTQALKEYLYFQLYLGEQTLFSNILELKPSHSLIVKNGKISISKYWEVYYNLDWDHTSNYFSEKLKHLITDSIQAHTVSDVPIGAYVSGGIDSGIVSSVAAENDPNFLGFTGKFEYGELFDESEYAREIANASNFKLHEIAITAKDFENTISKVIYHLDQPLAGPGSFPQFHVSKLAAQYRKVVLGGQGGDEIFGGYTRYLIAYFEQCIKGAIDGTLHNGNFIVTYESIIPNLVSLQNYKPLLKEFFKDGMFEPIDQRYFRLVNRAPDLNSEVNWNILGDHNPFESFIKIFNSSNVGKESYFDKMTHFDFKTLLPALLHVEDRMSMAHGLESRVPFLDHALVEFAATIPADKKFKDGTLKMILTNTMAHTLPKKVVERKNKMGFPVPLNLWMNNELKDFIHDTFNVGKNNRREFFNYDSIFKSLKSETAFGRKVWGLLSLELWFQQFSDNQQQFKQLLNKNLAQ